MSVPRGRKRSKTVKKELKPSTNPTPEQSFELPGAATHAIGLLDQELRSYHAQVNNKFDSLIKGFLLGKGIENAEDYEVQISKDNKVLMLFKKKVDKKD